jgi:hypothetical protein
VKLGGGKTVDRLLALRPRAEKTIVMTPSDGIVSLTRGVNRETKQGHFRENGGRGVANTWSRVIITRDDAQA